MTFPEYIESNKQLAARLDKLLGTKGAAVARDLLSRALSEGRRRYRHQDVPGAHGCSASVQFVLEDMESLRTSHFESFSHLRSQLRSVGTWEGYFGVRQEIRTAASMAAKRLEFKKSETPDFIVRMPESDALVGVECTSCVLPERLSDPQKELMYKIGSALRKKSSKAYGVHTPILEIDITNLLFESAHGEPDAVIVQPSRRDELRTMVSQSPFESVLLFNYAAHPFNSIDASKGTTLTSFYNRADQYDALSPGAAEYLRHFPSGNFDKLVTISRSV